MERGSYMRTRCTTLTALILLSVIALSQSLNPPMISSLDSTQFEVDSNVFDAEEINWNLVQSVSKETAVFTQGLEIHGGIMYESGGLYGHSTIRSFDVGSGQPIETVNLSPELFGEGLTIFNGEIIALTWKSGRVLFYSLTLEINNELEIPGEGWGICSLNDMVAISDGSSKITFRDPTNMAEISSLNVEFDGELLDNINELECVEDKIYANRWYDNRIYEIDTQSGIVTRYIDLSSVSKEYGSVENGSVLNGIAFDPSSGDFWITGKNWSDFHRITFVTVNNDLTDDFQVNYLIGILVSIAIIFPLIGSFLFSIRRPKGIQASPYLARRGGAPNG